MKRAHTLSALAALVALSWAALERSQNSWTPLEAAQADSAKVRLESHSSHPLVLAGGEREVFLYLALRAAELESVPRPRLNLALVIDRSGSMASEQKLVFAKSAASQVVERLRPDDRLAIVAYDDAIETAVPSRVLEDRARFHHAIAGLSPGGSTDLHGGMLSGYEEVLRHFDAEAVNRVVLLSDGLANHGVTDGGAIRARASACRERGVAISTLGMGLQYDEVLLTDIARGAGGTYYYVADAESVGEHLDREIDQLARVVGRSPEVRVALGEGVELKEVFGYDHRLEGRTAVIALKDVASAERRKLVLRLGVRGTPGEERTLATTSLRYVDAETHERFEASQAPLRARFSADPLEVEAARDSAVLVKVEVVQNAVAMEQAMALQKEGQFAEAQALLAARYLNSKTLNDAEYQSAELTRMLGRMKEIMLDIERTQHDARARRDLQLTAGLEALGYIDGD